MNQKIPVKHNRKRRRKKRRGGFVYILAAMIVIAAALSLSLSVFFKINRIEVTGVQRYTEESVRSATGVSIGDNIFAVDKEGVEALIQKELPYIESVSVSRRLPDCLVVGVTESEAAGYIQSSGKYWVVNRQAKVVEAASEPVEGLARITGIEPLAPAVGDDVYVAEENEGKKETLVQMLTALSDKGIDSVSEISITDAFKIEFTYLGRFAVKVEFPCNISKELDLLLHIVADLESNAKGTIFLTEEDKARFVPADG